MTQYQALWPLIQKANRGFRGHPIATIAFYGPDDKRASKVVVAIVPSEGAEPQHLERWLSDDQDVRNDSEIAAAMIEFVEQHGAKTAALSDRIVGCPHEEGVDYPDGQKCPKCPYWAMRDRWSGDLLH